MRRSSVLPTGKTLARTEFTSDRAFQIRAPVGRQPNGTSAAMRSEFHKGYQSISDLRFSGVWEIQAISTPPQMRRSSVLPTGKTLARTEFTSDRAFQIRAPVGRQPNGTSAAMRSEFHKGYQSISDLRFSGVWEIQAISTPPQMRRSSVLPTGKTLARTEFTSDRAFQIRAPVGRQPNGTSAAMRSEFHKGYQSIVTSLVERKVCAAHGANDLEIFCRDMCVAKNTSHAASVEGRSPR